MTRISTDPGFPDRLNWRGFVAPGVIINEDKAFLAGWAYGGPDQDYAEFVSMESLANQLNAILAKLSGGWMLHAEAIRAPITIAPSVSHYPDLTSQLMGEERANEYVATGRHFETRLVFVLTWMPPLPMGRGISRLLFGSRRRGTPYGRGQAKHDDRVLLEIFQRESQAVADALGHFLKVRRLTDDELKKFLWHCVTGEDKAVGTAPSGGMLNYALGAVEMEPPRQVVAGRHVRVVGVYGFPAGTTPQMLTDLLQLPMALRVSQRFIFLASRKAVKELERKRNTEVYRNTYNPKVIGWGASKNLTAVDVKDTSIVRRNTDADNQVDSIDQEITQLEAGTTRGGYYTLVVILRDTEEDVVDAQAAEIVQMLNRKGFQVKIEDDNFPAAFKGSLPGHSSNVRKPRLTVPHLVRLLVTSSSWRGNEQPSALYPKRSGPLLICKSTGNTPFCFTPPLHVAVIGPNGSGKTTLFNAASMAHLQYENAQVFCLDNGAGGSIPCWAAGGEVFDLDARKYAPLALIHQADEYAWALDFCERLIELRDTTLTGEGRRALAQALQHLAKAPIAHRTMTGLLGQLQTSNKDLLDALGYYAGTMPGAIIDGQHSEVVAKRWLNFDMQEVQKRSEAVRVPVLLCQLHELDRRIEDNYPTQIFIDEGGLAVGDVLLRDFIERDSVKLRKKVVQMWLVLHSPEAFKLFPQAGQLLNNIGTYVFLPNEMADTDAVRPGYLALGLNRRVITKLATEMVPRRHYLVKEGEQMRIFELPWGRWSSALFGIDGRIVKPRILELREQYREEWLAPWLRERGFADLAEQIEERSKRKEAA